MNRGLIPWLHLEGHGLQDQSGFVTANTSHCSWTHLKTLITSLNVATNLNVVIILLPALGEASQKAITTSDRASVLGVVGPTREVSVGEVRTDFPAFYKTFFSSGSLKAAVVALTARATANLYYCTTAKQFFYEAWTSYKKNHCSEEQIRKRAWSIYRKLKKHGLTPSDGQLKRLLSSEEKQLFEKYRDCRAGGTYL